MVLSAILSTHPDAAPRPAPRGPRASHDVAVVVIGIAEARRKQEAIVKAVVPEREAVMPEEKLRALVGSYGFIIANLSSRLVSEGRLFEYRMVIATRDHANVQKLAQHLLGLKEVVEFSISPNGD